MKKYFSIAIASLLMAAPLILSSCGDNDDLIPNDNQEQVITEWIEPYHEKNSTPDDVKAYMTSYMKSHHLVNETYSAENIQLAYSTGDINVGVLYSFTTVSGTLYSVIDTELTVNSPVVIDYLQKHYNLVSSNKTSLQYCFTTQDKSMIINTVKVSDTCFNVNFGNFLSLFMIFLFFGMFCASFYQQPAIRNDEWNIDAKCGIFESERLPVIKQIYLHRKTLTYLFRQFPTAVKPILEFFIRPFIFWMAIIKFIIPSPDSRHISKIDCRIACGYEETLSISATSATLMPEQSISPFSPHMYCLLY